MVKSRQMGISFLKTSFHPILLFFLLASLHPQVIFLGVRVVVRDFEKEVTNGWEILRRLLLRTNRAGIGLVEHLFEFLVNDVPSLLVPTLVDILDAGGKDAWAIFVVEVVLLKGSHFVLVLLRPIVAPEELVVLAVSLEIFVEEGGGGPLGPHDLHNLGGVEVALGGGVGVVEAVFYPGGSTILDRFTHLFIGPSPQFITLSSIMNIPTRAHSPDIFVLCLNPKCPTPQHRCLDGRTIRTHPTDCSKHYYPADVIATTSWTEIPDYPSDPIGKAVAKKTKSDMSASFFSKTIEGVRTRILKIIDEFMEGFKRVYPMCYLEEKFEEVYGLDKVGACLREKNSPDYISRVINQNLSGSKFNDLMFINEKLDRVVQGFDTICEGVQKHLSAIIAMAEQSESLKRALPEHYDKKINYGMIKSKYIASSKITVSKGVITFPKMENVASFLPWIYSDCTFGQGSHTLRISSMKFPLTPNSGLLVLEEHDADTYPYTYFKSLFSSQGKGFTLTSGSEIEHFIGETTSVILTLEQGPKPRALLRDSQLRCQYECALPEDRSYRLGIYGGGWAIQVLELS